MKDSAEKRIGYVYLCSVAGLHKIGKSKHPAARMSELCKPFGRPTLIHVITSDAPFVLEKKFHGKFALKRTQGEWYHLDAEDIEYIKSFSVCNLESLQPPNVLGKIRVAERLTLIRREKGLTQGQVAADVGISQAHLSNLESGKYQRICVPTLWVLADFFHVSIDWLAGRTDERQRA